MSQGIGVTAEFPPPLRGECIYRRPPPSSIRPAGGPCSGRATRGEGVCHTQVTSAIWNVDERLAVPQPRNTRLQRPGSPLARYSVMIITRNETRPERW